MSKKEIMIKAIKLAITNASRIENAKQRERLESWTGHEDEWVELMLANHSMSGLIFSHWFAKALWGDKNPEGYMLHVAGETLATEYIDYSWHYHLQQMVVADDPIKYLGENI